MTRLVALILVSYSLLSNPSFAQDKQPYAGFGARQVKALSDQQIADLNAGRGMGLALAAELNGYPGPMHVLELARSLNLSDSQRVKMQDLIDAMKAEAVKLGDQVIAAEVVLDRQFADKTATESGIYTATQAIGDAQAKLRAVHLKYHLMVVDTLTARQVQQYAELRGYSGHHKHNDPSVHHKKH